MNLSLFKSIHAIIGVVICALLVVWAFAIDAKFGARAGSDTDYVIWTGWAATGMMVVAMAYCLRKYMHLLGFSPEFKQRVPVSSIEAAETALNAIRARILKGQLTDKKEIEGLVKRTLKEEGVQKVMECAVETGDPNQGEAAFTLRTMPKQAFGRMRIWLHVHAYYGFFSGVIVWFHGAGDLSSPMGIVLNVLTYLVIVTGVIGIILWAIGPAMMTKRETDLNFEESFVLNQSLSEKIEALIEKNFEEEPQLVSKIRKAGKLGPKANAALMQIFATEVAEKPEVEGPLRDAVVLLSQRARMRRGLSRLTRLKFWLNIWRAVHIPASLALIGVVILHIFSVWYY